MEGARMKGPGREMRIDLCSYQLGHEMSIEPGKSPPLTTCSYRDQPHAEGPRADILLAEQQLAIFLLSKVDNIPFLYGLGNNS